MSDLSLAAHKAHARLTAWLAKRHPGDQEIAALDAEAQAIYAGALAAAKDAPALMRDVPPLAAAVGKLLVDLVAKTANLADVVQVGECTPAVVADVHKALEDFEAGYLAASHPHA